MLKAWGHLASALCCAAPPFAAQASSLFLTHEIHAARFQHGVELKDWSQEKNVKESVWRRGHCACYLPPSSRRRGTPEGGAVSKTPTYLVLRLYRQQHTEATEHKGTQPRCANQSSNPALLSCHCHALVTARFFPVFRATGVGGTALDMGSPLLSPTAPLAVVSALQVPDVLV